VPERLVTHLLFRKGHWGWYMDVVISSGWRNSTSTMSLDTKSDSPIVISTRSTGEAFTRKFGRYEVSLFREGDGWVVEFTSSGRLFGPRVQLYRERHEVTRYAAWDFMARVIRATENEEEGVRAGRQAAAWMREHDTSVC
jgi:hypothetical protein